ncbi:MAG: hypothetical protein U9Q88_01540 [Bacillota bacterium]|nr:hypothetical protein [Bacillota bacterium]
MKTNEILINSIENVRSLIDNSVLILKDLDTYLSERGFVPLYGNAIGTESSKSINQSSNTFSTFFPQFMFRPYAEKKEIDTKSVNKVVAINIQFFHPNHEGLAPLLIAGVFEFPSPMSDPKNSIKNWWFKYAALEYQDELLAEGEMIRIEPFSDDSTAITYWTQPLASIENQNDIKAIVRRLHSVY